MPTLVFVVLIIGGLALVGVLSAHAHAALAESLFEYAARHGRFHGLAADEPARGTSVDDPPRGHPAILREQSA